MTLTSDNFTKLLKSDLGENIIQHARISENALIDFINPCTGLKERINITHKKYTSDDIVKVVYVPSELSCLGGEEVEVNNLDELYEFILIEESFPHEFVMNLQESDCSFRSQVEKYLTEVDPNAEFDIRSIDPLDWGTKSNPQPAQGWWRVVVATDSTFMLND